MRLLRRFPMVLASGGLLCLLSGLSALLSQWLDTGRNFAQLWLVFSVPGMVLLALWGDRHLGRLRKHLNVDTTTGLASRVWFEQRLAEECARAQRDVQPVSVVVLQVHVDHPADENRILAAVGEHLLNTVRQGETVSRIADNRLALIAINCDAQQAELLRQRVQGHLENLRVQGGQGRLLSFHWIIHLLAPEKSTMGTDYFRQRLRTL